jgi:cyclopropane fatty-acyl-phospholipid synthase-like methyltransferase
METYTAFAEIYDACMEEIPYDAWCSYICELLEQYQVPQHGLILELGCGTGAMTSRLAQAGYDMIGVDNSMEMLDIAREKAAAAGQDILYLAQDMQAFELYGTVGAIVSLCDSINYLTEYEELVETIRLANNYLDPGGVFIFDLKTEGYYRQMGDYVTTEETEEATMIWENTYYEEERINEYALTIFKRQEASGLYEKETELHQQRAYLVEEIRQAVAAGGMELLHIYADGTYQAGDDEADRLYVIAREKPTANKVYQK